MKQQCNIIFNVQLRSFYFFIQFSQKTDDKSQRLILNVFHSALSEHIQLQYAAVLHLKKIKIIFMTLHKCKINIEKEKQIFMIPT